ncbi:PREDICTED: uncharacterized protein LOC101302340 [Fragaria vesca subsp. vesca]|uniref:uncharacterized protein LOC101302340 n=1 Tax=Fragaria vesca subsp. vesca TaxID=101020 RepID=UPI0002C336B1|nr:PREDICTED: uncharacterized protein LOC101302340 [Fragaria vesca subsp. vesca]XP_011461609.1 PREDICTED: uncharacterized protein LOC101302340 [Fragaria vesca subsp. vesca]
MDADINSEQRPPQAGEASNEAADWRNDLMPDARQRIVNKIIDTLKRHLPFSGQEGLHELHRIAARFEEKVYAAASSQTDYLRRICIKMLTMEAKKVATSPPSNLERLHVLDANINSGQRPPQGGEALSDADDWRINFMAHSRQRVVVNMIDQRPSQAREASNEAGDWRMDIRPDSRQRIANKILDTLKRHLPFSGQEGLHELHRIAARFEEKVYAAASSQSDYLRKISLKMLTMESRGSGVVPSNLKRRRILAGKPE